jgi:hypothetical protein
MRSWRSLTPLVLASAVGCNSGTEPTPPPPSFSHEGMPDITGSIFLGSGDQSICSVFSGDTPFLVRAFSTDFTLSGSAVSSCPANDYVMPVEPGSFLVRLSLPPDQPLGLLPRRWLDPVPVVVEADNVVRDIHVENGTPLGGRATVDGQPAQGVSLTASYVSLEGFAGNFGVSGPDGTWDDGLGRSAFVLQNDMEYVFSGCEAAPVPGIKSVTGFPPGPVLFPSTSRVDCEFTSGDALKYTHKATRLKLTSFPGDIGGGSVPFLFPELGYGYSAQFPLPLGQSPQAGPAPINRQLFRGGLVLAIGADRVLSGTELEGYVMCSVSPCRAFGFDGKARVVERGGKREITWTYSDAGSQRPQGLRVVQRSFDGGNGHDYVLYGFQITNGGTAPVTFTPGLFLDFDVSPEFFSNIAYTELNGQLAVTTNPEESLHFGSLVVSGASTPAPYFFSSDLLVPESDIAAALRGEISSPEQLFPTDMRQIQGGTAITLKRGKSAEFWVAIVAGESRAEIMANAEAAKADGNARLGNKNSFTAALAAELVQTRLPAHDGRAGSKLCKRGCLPDAR